MTSEATVRTSRDDVVNHGHCFSNIDGLAAGDLVEIASPSATIFCRVAWSLTHNFDGVDEVVLDRMQCSTLWCADGSRVRVNGRSWAQLPVAESVELRMLRGDADLADPGPGFGDFLRSRHYPVYPGLRFTYQPLADSAAAEYRVTAVRSRGTEIEVARVAGPLAVAVQHEGELTAVLPTYEDLGGLDHVVAILRREVELPLRRPADLHRLGVHASAGIVLHGPPGVGKTSLARAVGAQCGTEVIMLSGPSLSACPRPEAEELLRAAFDDRSQGGPRLVIVDDVDYLAPSRENSSATVSFLGLLQQLLDEPGRPVVIATTNRLDDVDPAIKRFGRLGRQIALPLPAEDDRRAILAVHTRALAMADADDAERSRLLADLAARTSGFVGADLAALCHEAGRTALRRAFPLDLLESTRLLPETPLEITEGDWLQALTVVTPSAIGGVVSEVPSTTFADVAGLDDTVLELRERLVLPLTNRELFAEAGLPVERGVLLYGPPGTGKTLLARALAHECGQRFLSVRGPELLNKWFGESERAVRDIFDKARNLAPSILFFDEIDALVPHRGGSATDGGAANRVVNQILAELDGLQDLGNVTVVGATNNPENLDPALLRPGRLGLHIRVGLPDLAGRRALLSLYLPDPALTDRINDYAATTEGMSGADIAMVAREARLAALRRVGFTRVPALEDEDVMAGVHRHHLSQSAVRGGNPWLASHTRAGADGHGDW